MARPRLGRRPRFVARRLDRESVGLIFAARAVSDELVGLAELGVAGLSDVDAHALLDSLLSAPLDPRVREQIVSETRGIPLAMLEVLRDVTPAELAGGFGLARGVHASSSIEETFRRRVDALPSDSRRLVQLAAADPVGDPLLVWRAADRLGISTDAATAPEQAGLLELGARVRFRHPLVRSAAYTSASLQERRDLHRALAAETDPEIDPDRHAWHRAQAAAGPDEDVAEELDRSAARAQARGGLAAAAAFLERSAELTRRTRPPRGTPARGRPGQAGYRGVRRRARASGHTRGGAAGRLLDGGGGAPARADRPRAAAGRRRGSAAAERRRTPGATRRSRGSRDAPGGACGGVVGG